MYSQTATMYSIEQLQLLRSARAIIKKEFGFSLSVSAVTVLEDLYAFAITSTDETLFKLHKEIIAVGERTMAEAATRPGSPRNTAYRGSDSAAEKTASNDKRPQMYRGAVVSEPGSAKASNEKATYYRGVKV